MAYIEVKDIAIKGMSACVPKDRESIADIYKWEGKEGFISTTGVKYRHRSDLTMTTADMCQAAAEKLIEELGWDKKDVDILILVTQTPDYYMTPATACVLQEKLGLPTTCYAADVTLGCSGWVYGLSIIASLMQNGAIKKGLLLAGDTFTRTCGLDDKSTYPLFGDAGTATALEYVSGDSGLRFGFNTDGKGYEAIIIRNGGFRHPLPELPSVPFSDDLKEVSVELEGMDVFSFGINKAPKSVKNLCEKFSIDINGVDIFAFHQANLMMNEMIRKKLKISESKVPYSLGEYGNTSSASIPLTLVSAEAEKLRKGYNKIIACGFGVGLSWGSVYFETNNLTIPSVITL